MKNIITKFKNVRPVYFVVAFVMLAVALAVPMLSQNTMLLSNAAENKTYYMGDVDFNGKVEASDARTILRASVMLDILPGQAGSRVAETSMSKPTTAQLADIDQDGYITSADARAALRISVQLDRLISFVSDGNLEESTDKNEDPSEPVTSETPTGDPSMPTVVVTFKGDGFNTCLDCGKRLGNLYVDREEEHDMPYPTVLWCAVGGCSRSELISFTCKYCGEYVPRSTCHTCKTLKPEWQAVIDSDWFQTILAEKLAQ